MVLKNLPVGVKLSYQSSIDVCWDVKVRESLHTQVIISVNTILNHTADTRMVLPQSEILARHIYRPGWYRKQKQRQIPIATTDLLPV